MPKYRETTSPERASRPSPLQFKSWSMGADRTTPLKEAQAEGSRIRNLRSPTKLRRPFGNDGQLFDMGEVVCPECQKQVALCKALREAEDACQERGVAPYAGYETILRSAADRLTETEKRLLAWEHQVALIEAHHLRHIVRDVRKEGRNR